MVRQRGLALNIMEAGVERREILGVPLQDFIVDRDRADNAAEAACLGATQAKQANEVAAIGVERQIRLCLLAAHI